MTDAKLVPLDVEAVARWLAEACSEGVWDELSPQERPGWWQEAAARFVARFGVPAPDAEALPTIVSEPTQPRPHVSEAWAVWSNECGPTYDTGYVHRHRAEASAAYERQAGIPSARVVRVRVTVEPIEEAK